MQFKLREMSPGKERRRTTEMKQPTFYSVTGFKKEHYAPCVIYVQFEDEEAWLNAVALQNPVTKKWVINGIDQNYNQVVLDVREPFKPKMSNFKQSCAYEGIKVKETK